MFRFIAHIFKDEEALGMSKAWHAMETDEVMRALNVDPKGLTSKEAEERLQKKKWKTS